MRNAKNASYLIDLLGNFVFGHGDDRGPQREGQIVAHGQMGIEGILLEHHRHIALRRGVVDDRGPADADIALVGTLQPGNQAQGGGLAGPGGAEEDHEGTVGDGHRDVLQHLDRLEGFGKAAEHDFSHDGPPRWRRCGRRGHCPDRTPTGWRR